MTSNSPPPNSVPPTPSSSPVTSPPATVMPIATRLRNFVIVLVSVILGVAVFLGMQTGSSTGTLAALAKSATPLEIALSNHRPTLMEFYADWCTSCQAMAKDMGELKQEYGQAVNFVMLNVDNNKWLPEMLHYRVEAIPHFVFLDRMGESIASTIGEQPRPIMAANLSALSSDTTLPYIQQRGRISQFEAPVNPRATAGEDPRSHGAQVMPQGG
ncbi:MAG: thioredoxin family protein [Elainella sp. Prado103]|nr:thioredoxin family protein [Elainella sp. Prado103]